MTSTKSGTNSASSRVDKVVDAFTISLSGMREVSSRLTQDFEKGLLREGKDVTVKMLVTYVHALPDGTEKGDFLALDLGGSNFRVLHIKIKGGEVSHLDMQMKIDDKTKQGTQQQLFDFIANSVAQFCETQKLATSLPLGFTFSFPVHQTSLTSGKLIRWTKDFSASGAVGEDVVRLLKEAFLRKKMAIDIVALVNDTTGSMLTVAIKDPECHVGLILGTGTNACYMESLDAIPKFNSDNSQYSKVIVNTEWGAFGDDGQLDPYMTAFDKELDTLVVNRGQQTYEKMISGKYIGELARLAMKSLIKDDLLFGGKSSDAFEKFEEFGTQYVSQIEAGGSAACRQIMKDYFSIEASDSDCEVVRRVCEAVSTRAARLAAAGIVALARKINKLYSCTVAVDGSLYKKHPNFAAKMKAAMQELAPGNRITMKLSDDGSGRGAGIVASVACRLKAASTAP